MNPSLIKNENIQEIKPVKIKTIFAEHSIKSSITFPCFKEFNNNINLTFLLFKFHNYFDGLIGLDTLLQMRMTINFDDYTLSSNFFNISILFKPNYMSKIYKLPPKCKMIVSLPVDFEKGDIFIKNTEINKNVVVSEGLYKSHNWHALVEISNLSDIDQTIVLEQPIKVCPLKQNIFEVYNFSINTIGNQNLLENKLSKSLRLNHLNMEEQTAILNLCTNYKDIFFQPDSKLSFTNEITHKIQTKNDIPIYSKSYRYPFIHKVEVQNQIREMISNGIIRPSYSPWSSPIWIVPKKQDSSGKQKWRLVIDYRKLNENTIDDRYPIPNINDILDKLGKCNYFSTIDLASGFHQIEINKNDIPKTAFSVENGHYEFLRMPFGLKNAPSTFQRVMDNVLHDLQGNICLVYMDDIIIYSTSLQEHINHIKLVFERLRNANLKIQIDKSQFLQKEVAFLGHIVTPQGIKPNPDKLRAIKEFPLPKTTREIKSFLGLLGYYRKFIKNFSQITKPFTECLKKGNFIKIDDNYISCFEFCKNLLCNDPILQFPDFEKPFVLTTDASNHALGAILSQGPIGSDLPISYASRTLTSTEQNYSTIEKELLAIVWATKYFRPYLFGHKFKIVTDHKPLTWLFSLKEPNSKLVRWRLKLEEFDYEIVYKKGTENSNADSLSRIKIFNTETMHSAEENLHDGIPISEKPLNSFSNQIILDHTDLRYNQKVNLKIIFSSKKRYIIRRNDLQNLNSIKNIFQKLLVPKKTFAIYTDDETFKVVQTAYTNYFSNGNFKLVRTRFKVEDIENIDQQEELIRQYHDKSIHRGIEETTKHLQRTHYFPRMKELITKIINNCEICAENKYERQKNDVKFEISETPKKPLEIVHIDIYNLKNKNILTIIDKFSKFAAAYILTSRNSISIIESLRDFFSHHGIPGKIISDNAQEFLSSVFTDFLKLHNINHHKTCAKNSTGNSPIERFHSTLTELARIIYHQNPSKTLKTVVDESLLAYNNSIHSATNMTPFELLNGHYNPPNLNLPQNNFNSQQDYIQLQRENYEKLRNIIHQKCLKFKEKNINKLNISRNDPLNFSPSENILEHENRRNKIAPRFLKHKIKRNNKITVITNKRKVHKQKIKPKRKFLGTPISNA